MAWTVYKSLTTMFPRDVSLLKAGALVLCFFLTFLPADAAWSCPAQCFCNRPSRVVYCSRKNLAFIPPNLPDSAVEVNLNENNFAITTLRRQNFSAFVNLEHLYMSNCGIETIEVDTFRDLKRLKRLDLSKNRIKLIHDYSFRGITLDHLFLNGNNGIRLSVNAFQNFQTGGLHLHRCGLTHISKDVLSPLSGLKMLALNHNKITQLDPEMVTIFSNLTHLRLGSNPLHCNCEMKWLKDFFDLTRQIFSGSGKPRCGSPENLKQKHFDEFTGDLVRCEAPLFHDVNVVFDEMSGRLSCSASGDPVPTLYWITPSGDKQVYFPRVERKITSNTALLQFSGVRDSMIGKYTCLASNTAGNVTLSVNVTWPNIPDIPVPSSTTSTTSKVVPSTPTTMKAVPKVPTLPTTQSVVIENKRTIATVIQNDIIPTRAPKTENLDSKYKTKNPSDYDIHGQQDTLPKAGNVNAHEMSGKDTNVFDEKRFKLHDIIAAVVGTFVCTVIFCVIIFLIIRQTSRTRRKRRQRYHQNGHLKQNNKLRETQQTKLEPGQMPELVEFLEAKEKDNKENHIC